MHRIDTATREIDKHGAGKHGYTEGDSKAGVAPTQVSAKLFDALQEEIAGPIETVGRVLDADDHGQLLKALRDQLQLGEWRVHEPPDANSNGSGAFRPLVGSDEPLIVVWDGANSRKTSIDGQTWTSGSGFGPFTEAFDCLWSPTHSKFYAAGTSGSVGVSSLNATLGGITLYALGGVDYHGIANEDAAYTAVGAGGSLYTSSNGTTWTARASGTGNTLRAVAVDDGTWIAVGDSGTITRSTNLTAWGTVVSGTAADLRGVAYGAGVWVVVGAGGVARFSVNGGTTWTASSDVAAVAEFRQVRWSSRHDVFIAVGDESSGLGVVALSRDGDTWVKLRGRGPSRLYDVIETDANSIAIGESGGILSTRRALVEFD